MAGITGLGTTYNLPNYTGMLIALTPSSTPLLSAIGGLTGGRQSTATQFEWETFDLRAAGQNVVLEGQDAPSPQERVRANKTNVTEIHQEAVSVSYTKLAAVGQKNGLNNAAQNPIDNELDWQIQQMMKQMARDINYSFIQGQYQLPTDNTTARKSRGLLQAITSNVIDGGVSKGASTFVGSTGVFTTATHGLSVGDQVVFSASSRSDLLNDTTYYVLTVPSGTTFTVGTTAGGSTVVMGGNGTANVDKASVLTVDGLGDVMQAAYDSGGISEQETATLLLNSAQKRALTVAYMSQFGQYHETSRNVGGVNVTTVETDFGMLNVMLDRQMPQSEVAVVSLEQLSPVFLEVPGKGHFFAEPLAKTGASDKVQFYGEVGLAYGDERAHGVLRGLAV